MKFQKPVFRIEPRKVVKAIISLAAFLLFYFLLLYDLKPRRNIPGIGETAPYDIISPRDTEFVDRVETERFRKEERERIPVQYRKDETVLYRLENKLSEIFKLIDAGKADALARNYTLDLSDYPWVESRTYEQKTELLKQITDFYRLQFKDGVTKNDKNSIFSSPPENIFRHNEAVKLAQAVFEPNLILDKKETQRLRDEAAAKVSPIKRRVKKGEVIVNQGDEVTGLHFRIFKEIGLHQSEQGSFFQKVGIFVFLVIVGILGFLYLYNFEPDIFREDQIVWMIISVMVLTMLGAKLFKWILGYSLTMTMENILGNTNVISPAAFPIAITAIILTVLVDGRLAIVVSVFLSTFAIYQLEANYYYVYYYLFGCLTAVFASQKASKTTDLSRNGLFVSLANMVVILALYLIFEDPLYHEGIYWNIVGRDLVWGFLNGIVSVALAIGFLPYFESVFRVSSSLRLLEFADLNQPLLKELMIDAPGTYQHSIVVGNLAQAAAQVVGADPLLCKIGGYYHDVGKLKRPQLFMENQMGSENEHDDLSPNLSALIISAHVKDGVEIARNNNLPEEVVAIVAQHHGTTLIQYFYEAAKKEKEEGEEVSIEQFKYPGPLPKTKEAAVVMLADSVESATRSLENPNASSIEAMIKKIINDKFVEGQFNDCNLTLKDIESMARIFIKLIITMYHTRVKYPDQDKEIKRMIEQGNEV